MTKNSAKKRAAREYKQAHPGMTLPEAHREIARPRPAVDWSHGKTPWVRTVDAPIICYLCGEQTMIRSFRDDERDSGRVQLYCENEGCDSREVELIVLRDGSSETLTRADVQVLNSVAPAAHRPARALGTGDDWIPGSAPWVRRTNGPVKCVFCGEQTCIRSRTDAVGDTGRVQLYCENAECGIREVELIVMRDGTPETQGRPDVEKLNAIDIPPALRVSGAPVVRPYGEARAIYKADDPLKRRR